MLKNRQDSPPELVKARQQLIKAQARVAELEAKFYETQASSVTPLVIENPYGRTLDNLLEGCQIIGFDWRYLYLNPAAMRHGHKTQDELLGYTMMECYPGIETTEMYGVLQRCMQERTHERLENEFVYPDGTTAWFDLSVEPVPDGIFILSLDVTELKKTQERLRRSEARCRSILEDQTEPICRFDTDLKLTYVNRPYANFFGKNPEDLIGHSLLDQIPVEDHDRTRETLAALTPSNHTVTSENRLVMADGSYRWFQWTDAALLDVNGHIVEYQGVGHDITERRLAKRELEALYNATSHLFNADSLLDLAQQIVEAVVKEFAHMDCGLMLVEPEEHKITRLARTGAYSIQTEKPIALDGDGLVPLAVRTDRVIYVPDVTLDPHYVANAHHTQSELVIPLRTSRGIIAVFDLQSPEKDAFSERDQRILTAYGERAAAALESMRLYEALNRHAAALEWRVTRRTVELQKAKERVEAILNNSADGILLARSDFTIQQANDAFDKLFASSPDEYFNQSLKALCHPDDYERLFEKIEAGLEGGAVVNVEARALRQDGSEFDAEFSIGFINHDGFVCLIRDITQRKAQERQLRYHASLQENVSDAVMSTDMEFRIQTWNKAAERVYGWRAEEVIGKASVDILNTQHRSQKARDQSRQLLFEHGWWQGEIIQQNKDGSIRHVLGSVTLVKDESGVPFGIVAVNRDITERKQVEEALNKRLDQERAFQNALKTLQEITIELTQITDLDTFFRRTVELGLERLGFERMSMYLYDEETGAATGTYGTDEYGTPISEHHLQFVPGPEGIMGQALRRMERFYLHEHARLSGSNEETLGTGWNAAAILWNGTQSLGWLVADNLMSQTPASKPQLDILGLYAMTVGTLLAQKQVQVALLESETRFRQFAENIDQVLFIRSGDNEDLLYINPAYETMWGRTIDGLYTNPNAFIEAVYPEDLPYVLEQFLTPAYIEDGRSNFEYRISLPDGRIRWIQARTFPIKKADGTMLRRAGIIEDITERKQDEAALKDSEENYRSLVETMRGGLAMFDVEGRFTYVNDQFCELIGYSRDELIGKNSDILLDEEHREKLAVENARREVLESSSYELTVRHKSGKTVHQVVSGSPLIDKSGNYYGSFAVVTDITPQKQAEEALRKALAKERELGELKSRFVSMASHEFRNPLASILAVTETLSSYRHKLTEVQIDERFGKIKDQVDHLKDIMEDMLMLARMQARRAEFDPVLLDPDELCRSVIDEFQSMAASAHPIEYDCQMTLNEVILDKKLMRQILSNLISNAIKYSPEPTPIKVKLGQVDDDLVLTVSDQGIGIPEADIEHLFEPFHRAANVGMISGTGLGLVIAKESVELHGGSIDVESQPQVGTTFTIRIPITTEENSAPDPDAEDESGAGTPHPIGR